MKLNIFKVKRRSYETRKKISETMKHTGMLWQRYLELKPPEYSFDSCKQFRTYLKKTKDQRLIKLLNVDGTNTAGDHIL